MKRKVIISWVMACSLIITVAIPATKVSAESHVGYTIGNNTVNYTLKENPESVKIKGVQVVGNTLETQFITSSGTEFKSALISTYRWYRLPSENSNGTLVGENATYVLSDSDIDQYIKVVVANNGDTFENIIGKIGKKSSSVTSGVITYGYWLSNNDGTKMYFENGKSITGWKQIDGSYYLFNSNGIMQTGWWRYNNKIYYLSSDGIMTTNWVNIDGSSYYFYGDGSMKVI